MIGTATVGTRVKVFLLLLIVSLGLSLKAANAGVESSRRLQSSPPAFSKAFTPDTIGPGSTSALTFTIDNPEETPVGDLAFTDTLPAGVTIATPSSAQSTCGGTVDAPDGGTTISFSGGGVGAGSTCTVVVNVTSGTPGTHTNTSGDLTSEAGNSGSASADLTVDEALPGFSKSFAPGAIVQDDSSRLTFTIDNSAGTTTRFSFSFSDDLPSGLVVASPSNAANDCSGTLSAEPGAATITFSGGFLEAGDVCTITVDVAGTAAGDKKNVSSTLSSSAGNSGFATALLEVEPLPAFYKFFSDDPVPPGGTATLEFSITNMDRISSAAGINFTDDLDAALSGLAAVPPLPDDPCGAGSALSGTSLLTMSGGRLEPAETCTFAVTVQVPAGATPGTYPNTTSSLESDAGFMADPATGDLLVSPIPTLLMSFLDDPAGTGETVDLEFTLVNGSNTNSATDISFSQPLSDVLPGVTVQSLPASGFCGPASTIEATTATPFNVLTLIVGDGSLGPGDSCTFVVTLQLSSSTPNGVYTLTSSAPQATVGDETLTGHSASVDLTVVAPPSLSKSFSDDPVLAGDTVTLEFRLVHSENAPGEATGITFTDDLDGALTGLVATGLPANDVCGAGSQLSGTSTLTFSGGSLLPTSTCTFSVTLQVPAAAAPGSYANTTSDVSATVDGLAVTGDSASDDLEVAALTLDKSFSDDPVLQGDKVTLEFTLSNESTSASATDIAFSDDLEATLSGLTAQGLPAVDICGAGSQLSGTSILTFSGGNLGPGASCTFTVTLQVPAAAAPDQYQNVTSPVSANLDGNPLTANAASDPLTVLEALSLAKSFTDDPVPPGGTVTLAFTVTNNSPGNGITDISFSDDLDAALSGLTTTGLPANDVCGAGSQLSGTSILTLTGGALAPGASCTFDVTLQVPSSTPSGVSALNTTSPTTGTLDGDTVTGGAAADELHVDLFAFTKSFDGPTVAGGNPTLSFTIENLDASQGQSGISFADNLDAVIPGLTTVGLPVDDVCGTDSQLSGTSALIFSGGSLAPGASCTFSVTLQVPATAAPGSYLNTTSDLTISRLPVSAPATDSLVVTVPPAFAKAFAPNPILLGETSTLTFTVDNTANPVEATGLDFTDNLPAALTVATPANASTTCTGGTLSAAPGGSIISFSGGTLAAGASCTVSVDVTGNAGGMHVNTTGNLTSSLGASGTASDTLAVNPPPTFTKNFAPTPINEGDSTTLTFTIDNGSSTVQATGLDFADKLPAGLTVATPANASTTCTGGTLSAASGATTIAYSGGAVAAGATCEVAVDVTAGTPGTYDNTSGALSSSLGTGGTATATLVVPLPEIDVALTALPGNVPEPGDTVLMAVRVTNDSPVESLTLTSLVDDVYGDLDGRGNCDVPAVIGIGESYTCHFYATVSGNAGEAQTNTVTATALDSDDHEATAQDGATVTLADVLPGISAGMTATPTVIYEPGGPVTFTVRVTNTSAAEPLSLAMLADDVAGDLHGLGTCIVPQTIAVGGAYQCRYPAQVSGQVATPVTNTLTATAEDDDGNQASAQAGATIAVYRILYYPVAAGN